MIVRVVIAVLVLLVSYAGFLVANTPASWVVAQAQPQLDAAGVSLAVTRGSAWNGSAELNLDKQHLGRLSWSTSPWTLMGGSVDADFSLKGQQLSLQGKVASADDTTRLGNLHGQAGINFLATLLNIPADLEGTLVANLNKVVLGKNQTIQAADGKLVAHGVRIPDLGVGLGTLTLTLENADNKVNGKLENSGGDIAMQGTLTLTRSGSYVFQATLKPRPGDKAGQIRDGLTVILGKTDSRGRFHYRTTGRIKLQ
jgi:hypothetical protein